MSDGKRTVREFFADPTVGSPFELKNNDFRIRTFDIRLRYNNIILWTPLRGFAKQTLVDFVNSLRPPSALYHP